MKNKGYIITLILSTAASVCIIIFQRSIYDPHRPVQKERATDQFLPFDQDSIHAYMLTTIQDEVGS